MKVKSIMLHIRGLACGGGGAFDIEQELLCMNGVMKVYVNPATEYAYIDIDTDTISRVDIERKIDKLGYRVSKTPEYWWHERKL